MPTLNKILVIRFSSLGDILLASPLLRTLRQRFPSAQIDFLVKKEYADVVRYNSNISHIVPLENGDGGNLRSLGRFIRKQDYDCLLDLHNSLRSIYLRAVSLCRRKYVIEKQVLPRYLLVHWKKNFYRKNRSVPERYFGTAQDIGVTDDGGGLEIMIPAEICSSVRLRLAKFHIHRYDRVIGIAPAARHFTKRWPAERFVECGIRLSKNVLTKILVFGGKTDAEYCGDIVHLINTELGSRGAESLAAEFTLLETAAAMDYCDLVISNDSGLMHLATARKRKVIAIFGSTVREFGFFPYRAEFSVLENNNLACRPCSHIGREKCPKAHFRCMKDISAHDVVVAAEKLYAK